MKTKIQITFEDLDRAAMDAAVAVLSHNGMFKDEPLAARRFLVRWAVVAVSRAVVAAGGMPTPLAVEMKHAGKIEQAKKKTLVDFALIKAGRWADTLGKSKHFEELIAFRNFDQLNPNVLLKTKTGELFLAHISKEGVRKWAEAAPLREALTWFVHMARTEVEYVGDACELVALLLKQELSEIPLPKPAVPATSAATAARRDSNQLTLALGVKIPELVRSETAKDLLEWGARLQVELGQSGMSKLWN